MGVRLRKTMTSCLLSVSSRCDLRSASSRWDLHVAAVLYVTL